MSENGEIYTAGKNFTLPPVVTAWTNLTFGYAIQEPSYHHLCVCSLSSHPGRPDEVGFSFQVLSWWIAVSSTTLSNLNFIN